MSDKDNTTITVDFTGVYADYREWRRAEIRKVLDDVYDANVVQSSRKESFKKMVITPVLTKLTKLINLINT